MPAIISLNARGRNTLLIRFSSGSYSEMAGRIGKVYERYETDIPYQPVLFRNLPDYSRLRTTSNLVGLAFIIALILTCLGFSGLASFTTERRTKEIGIRKTNGATIFSIMRLLLSNYTRWLTIAFFIALPIAFILGKIFLARFNFRTAMPLWTFIAGPFIAYFIAILTVSWQSWRAAVRNPAESLSCE